MRQPEQPGSPHGRQHSCLQWCPSPVELSTSPHRAHPLLQAHQPLPAPTLPPTSLWGSILQLMQTEAQNSLERPASGGRETQSQVSSATLLPAAKGRAECSQSTLEEEGFAAKESWCAPLGRSRHTRTLPTTALNTTRRRKWSLGASTTFYP